MSERAKRYMITGGAGLIGSHIADLLVALGAQEIIVVDNFVRGRRENLDSAMKGNVVIREGDIRDLDWLTDQMEGIDVVFHQAALRITQCAEDPQLALDVLVNGTFNVLEAAVAKKINKVIAASSASIYGMAGDFPTSERHHPYNNDTFYGAAKAFNEGMLRSYKAMYGLDYLALRYFNVYGPRMDTHGKYTEVLIRWMERIATEQPPLIFGDGKQSMDFVYVSDVARANILASQSPVSDEVINVGSGKETSLRKLAECVLNVMDANFEPAHLPERTISPVQRRLADTRKAKKLLGFEARVSLDEGVRKLVEWWQGTRASSSEDLEARP